MVKVSQFFLDFVMEELQNNESLNSSKNMSGDSKISDEQIFDNKDKLLTWVRDIGKINGFVIIIRTSDYGGGRKRPRIYLDCERSGKYRSHNKLKDGSENLLRQTDTKKCKCPFDLRAYKLKTNDEWTLNVVCGLHDHPIVEHLQRHSYVGRLSANEKSLLVDMSKSLI
ncbi:iron-regulated transcriptional activator AFT2-like [Camellia sinensis]|uniref:iron-regulated transcriptional activator AFT2-like n=1 Tax=Camellia sinensis TaxID=4442 RepID=UPI001035C427|nr:iron-regulated transcriptional activator AFT2-like [Camellia sinensis]